MAKRKTSTKRTALSALSAILVKAEEEASKPKVKGWTGALFAELDKQVAALPADEKGGFSRKAWAERGVAELRKNEDDVADLAYNGLVGFLGLLASNDPEKAEDLAKRIKNIRRFASRREAVKGLQAEAVVERRDHDADVSKLMRLGKGAAHLAISLLPLVLKAGAAILL